MKRPIYFDYMATTTVDTRVSEKMQACLGVDGIFGNPSSNHYYGWEAHEKVEQARQQLVDTIGAAHPREIIWTSGATEANNLALQGALRFYQRKGRHLITMTTEHKSVLKTCEYLATQGYEVTFLNPEPNGLLDPEKLKQALRSDTVLVSIMWVNNEIGVIQDIPLLGELVKKSGALFHVDGVQGVGKLPLNLSQWPVDLMSFSAHKVYGPKGIGALYVRRQPKIHLEPIILGGEQEGGLRSGTLPTHQIVGMGQAFQLMQLSYGEETARIRKLQDRLWEGLQPLGGVWLNGDAEQRIPHNMNIRFDKVSGESLMLALREVCVSAGSACHAASTLSSHVLTAIGLNATQADQSLRFSFGRFTTEEEIEYALAHITEQVTRLRNTSRALF